MKKELRLKNSQEIGSIVNSRIKVSSKYYNLYYKLRNDTKIAIVAGKKCGNAVSRNYEKRVMRVIIKNYIKDLNNFHIVFTAKKEVVDASFLEKENDIKYLINKFNERKTN